MSKNNDDEHRRLLWNLYDQQVERRRQTLNSYFSLVKWGSGMASSIIAGEAWLLLHMSSEQATGVARAASLLMLVLFFSMLFELYNLFLSEMDAKYRMLQLEKLLSESSDGKIERYFNLVRGVDPLLQEISEYERYPCLKKIVSIAEVPKFSILPLAGSVVLLLVVYGLPLLILKQGASMDFCWWGIEVALTVLIGVWGMFIKPAQMKVYQKVKEEALVVWETDRKATKNKEKEEE